MRKNSHAHAFSSLDLKFTDIWDFKYFSKILLSSKIYLKYKIVIQEPDISEVGNANTINCLRMPK
jgi:hypothetical protein